MTFLKEKHYELIIFPDFIKITNKKNKTDTHTGIKQYRIDNRFTIGIAQLKINTGYSTRQHPK